MTTPPPYPPAPDNGPGAAPPYAMGDYPQQRPTGNGMAVAALVLGISSLALFFLAPFTAVLAILAIVFGAIGLNRSRKRGAPKRGLAIAGLILGCVGLVTSVILFVIGLQARERCKDDIGHSPSTEELSDCIDRGV